MITIKSKLNTWRCITSDPIKPPVAVAGCVQWHASILPKHWLATSWGRIMADANECRRQSAECARLEVIVVAGPVRTVLRSMATSWRTLANQMDRLRELDEALAESLALSR
jgi:hypothetical protein